MPTSRDDMPHRTGHTPDKGSSNSGSRRAGPESGHGTIGASTWTGSPDDVDRQAVERILTSIRDAGVQQVELQFSDGTGAVKTVAIPARRMQAVLTDGEWFDGSAIEAVSYTHLRAH